MVYLINDETLKEIADAIREKTSSSEKILTSDMPELIRKIKTSGGVVGHCIDEFSDVIHYDEFGKEAIQISVPETNKFYSGIQAACIDTEMTMTYIDGYYNEMSNPEITDFNVMDCFCVDANSNLVCVEEEIEIVKTFTKLMVSVVEG